MSEQCTASGLWPRATEPKVQISRAKHRAGHALRRAVAPREQYPIYDTKPRTEGGGDGRIRRMGPADGLAQPTENPAFLAVLRAACATRLNYVLELALEMTPTWSGSIQTFLWPQDMMEAAKRF